MIGTLVDWTLLGHVVLVAVLACVGVVAAFSIGLAALSFYRDADRSTKIRVSSAVVALLMTGFLVWALWWAFELITKKS